MEFETKEAPVAATAHFVGSFGKLDEAWFDAGRLSQEYAGIRCLIGFGEAGGLLCKAVRAPGTWTDAAIAALTLDVIEAIEEGDGLLDELGQPIELMLGDDHIPGDEIRMVGEAELGKYETADRLPWPVWELATVALLAAFGVLALILGWRPWVTCALFGCFAIGAVPLAKACYHKKRHDMFTDKIVLIGRQKRERRDALRALLASRKATA